MCQSRCPRAASYHHTVPCAIDPVWSNSEVWHQFRVLVLLGVWLTIGVWPIYGVWSKIGVWRCVLGFNMYLRFRVFFGGWLEFGVWLFLRVWLEIGVWHKFGVGSLVGVNDLLDVQGYFWGLPQNWLMVTSFSAVQSVHAESFGWSMENETFKTVNLVTAFCTFSVVRWFVLWDALTFPNVIASFPDKIQTKISVHTTPWLVY